MAGLIEQANGKLEISKTNPDFAYLQKNEDLKLRGHYIVRWKWRISGPTSNINVFAGISGSKLTAGQATTDPFFASGVVGQTMFFVRHLLGSGQPGHVNIAHDYRNTAGNIVFKKISISGSAWPQALEIVEELEYDGVNIFWRTDVTNLTNFTSIQKNSTTLVTDVKDPGEHFFMKGLPQTNNGSGIKLFSDDVEVVTVVPPP